MTVKSSRLLFVCYPDTNHPIGGVKQIYRQVELLCQLGFEAYVLQERPGFRVDWFASDAPVMDLQTFLNGSPDPARDVMVMPETWVSNIPGYLPGLPKIIFNQNAYYTFGLEGNFDASVLEHYRHPDVIGVVTVSEDNRNFLVDGCGLESDCVHVVINGIDARLFHPPSVKVRRIVYLGRKHVQHARTVQTLAAQRPVLASYPFVELGRLSHAEVAQQLQQSLVFLSCGHPEGFGLPLAEAIACGCIVVGYHGLAGRDYCSEALHDVDFGDLLGFVNALEAAVLRFEADPQSETQLLLDRADALLKRYSLDEEANVSSKVWSQLLDKHAQHDPEISDQLEAVAK